MPTFESGHAELDSAATMFAALEELGDRDDYPAGYRGTVTLAEDGSWYLDISRQGVHTVLVNKARIGDHLVITFGQLLHLTNEQYLAVL